AQETPKGLFAGGTGSCGGRRDCDTVESMQPARVPSIVVHGGAGADPADADEFRAGVRGAVLAGWTVLGAGGSALDAVEAAVRALEDHPRFNAGRGSEEHTSELQSLAYLVCRLLLEKKKKKKKNRRKREKKNKNKKTNKTEERHQ